MTPGQFDRSYAVRPALADGSTNGAGARQFHPRPAAFIQPLPGWVWMIAFLGAVCGLTSLYPVLIAASCFSLPIIASLLLFKGEPPVLFACCAMQWLQVVAGVFYAAVQGTTMERILFFPEMEEATWLSLGGVMVLAVGMRAALHSLGRGNDFADKMESNLEKMSISRLHQAWWVAFFIASTVNAVAWKMGSFRQFTTPIISIKWVFFYLLAYRVLARDEGQKTLVTVMVVEFVSGITGYFGSFKEVLLMFVIVFATLRKAISIRIRIMAVTAIFVGFVASVFWSVIKMEYRDFLIRRWGTVQGADFMTRLDVMRDLASKMDARRMEAGFTSLVARVSYVGLFGSTISWVPKFEPHSRGELWLGAVQHILMPRFIFPNKKALDDSERARRFTGIRLAGAEEGTSIGIGYMAESYADFGRYGMYAPIFVLGLFMGWVYQRLSRNKHSAFLGAGVATAVLFSLILAFANSNVKILGSMVTLWLAYSALSALWGSSFMRWLSRG